MSYQISGKTLQTDAPPSPFMETPPLLQYGGSSAAIILAVAVLLKAVAELIKVLVPVMLYKRDSRD